MQRVAVTGERAQRSSRSSSVAGKRSSCSGSAASRRGRSAASGCGRRRRPRPGGRRAPRRRPARPPTAGRACSRTSARSPRAIVRGGRGRDRPRSVSSTRGSSRPGRSRGARSARRWRRDRRRGGRPGRDRPAARAQPRRAVPGARLARVVDRWRSRRRPTARSSACPGRPPTRTRSRSRTSAAVVIAAPTPLHAEMVERAAARRESTCSARSRCRSTSRAASARPGGGARVGVRLQVGFQRRFDPDFVAANDSVDSGEIGAVRAGADLAPQQGATAPDGATERLGSLFVDMAIHDFDSARWLVGEVAELSAFATRDAASCSDSRRGARVHRQHPPRRLRIRVQRGAHRERSRRCGSAATGARTRLSC